MSDDREHSWQPVNVVEAGAKPPEPPTIGGLIYPGRRHLISGEPDAGKSWLALALSAEQIRAGHAAVYVSMEMSESEVLERLRALDLDDDQIRIGFIYLTPTEPLEDPAIVRDVECLLAVAQPTIATIDSFIGALSLHRADPNSAVDVERVYRTLIEPLRNCGAAVLVLDHVVKDREGRGKWATGSERKVGAADVHLSLDTLQPFGRGRTGRIKISVAKDRPGWLPRPRAGELELSSDPGTGRVTWQLHLAEHDAEPQTFRPTFLMQRVSEFLEGRLLAASRKDVETSVKGNSRAVRAAIEILVGEGYVEQTEGARGAKPLASIRPYREADDTTSATSADLGLTSARTTSQPTSATSATSLLDERPSVAEVAGDNGSHLGHPDGDLDALFGPATT